MKWPNDLYWRDLKVGGVLCQSNYSHEVCDDAVIAISMKQHTRERNITVDIPLRCSSFKTVSFCLS